MLLVPTVLLAAVCGFIDSNGENEPKLAAAPVLFDDDERVCLTDNPGHRARVAEEQALAKSERVVFDMQDGVEAVRLFAESESCYRKSDQHKRAEHVAVEGARLRRSIEEDYLRLRLRLSRALAGEDRRSAQIQVARLTQLLRHKGNEEYPQSLRRLSLRLAREGTSP